MRGAEGDPSSPIITLHHPSSPFIILAHRGASAVAPEGTRAAIREAMRAGADGVELDVQMTADERLVILHDDRVERTSDGTGSVARMRYAQLARLDIGRWFHPRFAGERVLLASSVFRLVPERRMVNLELKRTARGPALLRHTLRLAKRARRHRLLLSSFDPALIAPLAAARLPVALIARRQADRSLRQAIRLRCTAWHPVETLVTPQRIAQAHAAGLRVHVWTVNDVRQARRLARWGADGLFTNDPRRLVRAVRGRDDGI